MRQAPTSNPDKVWAMMPMADVVKGDTVDHMGYVTRVRIVMNRGLDVALGTQFGELVGPPSMLVDVIR